MPPDPSWMEDDLCCETCSIKSVISDNTRHSDGRLDHWLTYASVQRSLIALFLKLDLDVPFVS